jgi:glycosyltransferase involved in cell wall biosynthesis
MPPTSSPLAPALARAASSASSVVLAHDYLLVMRGAERTFAAMCDMYPHAPVMTLLYDDAAMGARFDGHAITTSPLQRLGLAQANFRRLLALYPLAARRLRAPACEVLLSSSSAFANAIPAPAGAVHVCYCHNTFRYAWHEQARALSEAPPALRPALHVLLAQMRRWDLAAARRVDLYIANSQLTRERIRRYYGREAQIVYPPVQTRRFTPGEPGEQLLIVSEIVRHKRVQVALEAARRARAPVRVAGSGPDHAELAAAYPEAEFLGRVEDDQLATLYAGARAVLVPSMEEFGIVAVEAQAAGRPVIAAAAGGALETVIDGETGRLVPLDDVDAFSAAIADLDTLPFDPARAVQNAQRFSVAAFEQGIRAAVADALARAAHAQHPPRAPRARGALPLL